MKQIGTVKEIRGNEALILVKRQSMCDGCHKESGCSGCSQMLEITVENTLGASVGDGVELETPGGSVIGVAALIFLVPLLLAFAAYFVIDALGAEEWISYLAAIAAPLLAYTVIAVWVRKSKKTLRVTMVSVIRNETDTQ